jgi:Flp pilus assembly protein TadG
MVSRSATHCPQHLKSRRRSGLAVLKVILLIPIILTLLALILEVGNLWIARLEFENALESAALAAVKEWGDANGASGTYVPRQVGNEFARSNTVRWNPVVLTDIDSDLNWDPSDTTNNPNENRTCPEGVLVFAPVAAGLEVFCST